MKMVLPPPPPPPAVAPHAMSVPAPAPAPAPARPPPLTTNIANVVLPAPPPPPAAAAAAAATQEKEEEEQQQERQQQQQQREAAAAEPERRTTISVEGGAELSTASTTEPASLPLPSASTPPTAHHHHGMRQSTASTASLSSTSSGVSFVIPPPPPDGGGGGGGGGGGRGGRGGNSMYVQETTDTERGLAPVRKGLVSNAADPSARPELLCEGYLDKLKNNMLRNRNRHFRLTEVVFAYHENNGGPCINVFNRKDLHSVEDAGGSKLSVVFSTMAQDEDAVGAEGGADAGRSSTRRILLQAPNARVKGKWMRFLTMDLGNRSGGSEQLVVEGSLAISRATFTSNGQRWFRVTERLIEINKDEEGEILYSILLTAVLYIDVTKDKREIKIDIVKPGSKAEESTSFILKAKNEREKNKWAATLQRVLPHEKLGTEFEMCPYMESY